MKPRKKKGCFFIFGFILIAVSVLFWLIWVALTRLAETAPPIRYASDVQSALVEYETEKVTETPKPTNTADNPPINAEISAPLPGWVYLRSNPEMGAAVLSVLDSGEEITIIGNDGEWVQVVSVSGLVGWVFGEYVKEIP